MIKNEQVILSQVELLIKMYERGELGGEIMPEDINPGLEKTSKDNYIYFTLPMALNYRRNSYKLWESAKATYEDKATAWVYQPELVVKASFAELQAALTKYNLALFKVRQTDIWLKLSMSIMTLFNGDLRALFTMFNNDVVKIRDYVQKEHKKAFPYLSGNKICNYWLYVVHIYCGAQYTHLEALNVAADTHVIKATHRLGLITDQELESANVQLIVIDRWSQLFKNTKYKPIDIHTILWLWSRNGFKEIINE